MVIECEFLNDFPGFVCILIAEFAAGGAINLALKMEGDMIIKNLDLELTIDAMMRDFLEVLRSFPVERIEQESGSKILPYRDGSCSKTFKPIASLIAKGKLK
ncbi:hypothetical protein Tco_0923375 [Tanacetum coccineum]|uniref:Uncharacterized protein n=1 Tax=Tanacetum coccineum TaxID=301880 RepID=A0ABQ5D444_9ASTR